MRTLLALVVGLALAAAACKKNKDAELQKALDDLRAFDEAIEDVVEAQPNGDGLATAESLVAAKKTAMHDRLAAFDVSEISPEAAMALANACASNTSAAQTVVDYVRNAVLKTNPELVARASRLAVDLCMVCPLDTTCGALAAH